MITLWRWRTDQWFPGIKEVGECGYKEVRGRVGGDSLAVTEQLCILIVAIQGINVTELYTHIHTNKTCQY